MFAHVGKKLGVHSRDREGGVDRDAALRMVRGDRAEAGADTGEEPGIEAFVTIEWRATSGKPAAGERGRDVEHEGQMGCEIEEADQGGDDGAVRPLAIPLIGKSGIEKPIADDGQAGGERGAERACDMLGAGGEVKQGFRERIKGEARFEEKAANGLRAGRAAGFTGEEGGTAGSGESLGEEARLC